MDKAAVLKQTQCLISLFRNTWIRVVVLYVIDLSAQQNAKEFYALVMSVSPSFNNPIIFCAYTWRVIWSNSKGMDIDQNLCLKKYNMKTMVYIIIVAN